MLITCGLFREQLHLDFICYMLSLEQAVRRSPDLLLVVCVLLRSNLVQIAIADVVILFCAYEINVYRDRMVPCRCLCSCNTAIKPYIISLVDLLFQVRDIKWFLVKAPL